ncbi:MAG TPA: cob(I)yrinic acid a,c-diamide adenosyltransferase [Pirellulales bacterium]
MKIYTKTGDDGTTGLFRGPRVKKSHPRIDVYGEVDELNAALGLARATSLPPAIDAVVERIQHGLFALGAELATPDPVAGATATITVEHTAGLERDIDAFQETLAPLTQFILPAGTPAAAALHLARTICRRAERRLVAMSDEPSLQREIMPRRELTVYLNRVSDLLFVLSRAANAAAGQPDVAWDKTKA